MDDLDTQKVPGVAECSPPPLLQTLTKFEAVKTGSGVGFLRLTAVWDLRYRWLITSGSARWLIEILSAILKSTRHGGQSTERCIAFGGTTRSPAFTMHKFMSENLRYERLRKSEPSIEKLIERLIKVIYIE